MPGIHKSYFKERSQTPKGKDFLVRSLIDYPLQTGELIGVVVHNVRSNDNHSTSIDTPIPIGDLDMKTLLSMNIVKSIPRSAKRTEDAPIAALSKLGIYVVREAIIVDDQIGKGKLPIVDTVALSRLFS